MLGVQLYLSFEDTIITDFLLLYAGQLYDIDLNSDGVSDALWCQSANNGSEIRLWYYPDGIQVPLFTGAFNAHNTPSPLFPKRFPVK